MASHRLRYGVIGTGMMGIEHLKSLALVPGAELVAFADPHEESRRWARLVAGEGPRAYADHRALLDDPRVDAVVRGASVEVTAEDGLRAVEIGAAAEQSVKEGRPIALGRAT